MCFKRGGARASPRYSPTPSRSVGAAAEALGGVAAAMKCWMKFGPRVRSWKKNLVPAPLCDLLPMIRN